MTEAHIIIEDVAQSDAAKHIKLVSISGQLDESNIDEKAKEIYALISANPQGLNIIFDFEKLEYLNSKSIGYLTDWFGKISEGQGKIVMIKARPNIIDILSVIGLTQLIPLYNTLEEAKFALANVQAGTPAPSTSEPVLSQPAVQHADATPESTPPPGGASAVPAPIPTPESPAPTAQAVPPTLVAPPAPVEPIAPPVPTVPPAPQPVPEPPKVETPAVVQTPPAPETPAVVVPAATAQTVPSTPVLTVTLSPTPESTPPPGGASPVPVPTPTPTPEPISVSTDTPTPPAIPS